MPYVSRAKFQSLATDATWKDTSAKYTHHLHLQAKSAGTTTRSSSRNLEGSFPDTAEFQEVYDESTIGCGGFMVIMEFFLCIAKEDCTLILETSEQIGDGSSGIDSGHRCGNFWQAQQP